MRPRRWRRFLIVLVGAVGVVVGGLFLTPFGKAIRDLSSRGVVAGFLPARRDRRITGDSYANLARIRTALLLYERSEEAFPRGPGWNVAVRKRLSASDLAPGEEQRILTRPGAASGGYALNAAAAGKYRGDLSPNLILVYETARTAPDAVGDPATDNLRGGQAITLAGNPVRLP